VTATNTTEARLQDIRAGWRMWCNLCDPAECTNADQAHGFMLASEANEGGGNRPTARRANELTAGDLPTRAPAPVAYLQAEINGQTFACDASNNRIDTFGGPSDFLARAYLRSGYRVIGADGREVLGT
jgi:hypothetical protein